MQLCYSHASSAFDVRVNYTFIRMLSEGVGVALHVNHGYVCGNVMVIIEIKVQLNICHTDFDVNKTANTHNYELRQYHINQPEDCFWYYAGAQPLVKT